MEKLLYFCEVYMKRLLHIILFVGFCTTIVAQEDIACPMHENVLTVEYGGIWQNDEYLSPLLYNGHMVGIQHEWWTDFMVEDWSHMGKIHITGAITDNNRAVRNMQYAIGVNGGWGAQYDFHRLMGIQGLHVFVGPYLHADFMGRSITSYTNKPYSMDMAVNIRLHAGVNYIIPCKRSAYRLKYTFMTDVMGVQFAPDYWQAYYEMLESMAGIVGFASFHNRQTLSHTLTLDMQFRRSTWRVGVRHEYLQYTMNNLHFSREQVCVVIGTVFNHRISKTPLK